MRTIVILALALTACQTRQSASLAKSMSSTPTTLPADCVGEAAYFRPVEAEGDIASYGFRSADGQTIPQGVGTYTFGACETANGTWKLTSVEFFMDNGNFAPIEEFWTPGAGDEVEGIEEAIFGQGLESLSIKIKDESEPGRSLFIKGWKRGDNESITLSRFAWGTDPMSVPIFVPVSIAGHLKVFDPTVPPTVCGLGRHIRQRLTDAEATVEIDYCYKANHQVLGVAIVYDFKRLTISDRTPGLAAPVAVELLGDDVRTALTVKETHHGFDDSFTINAGGVEYYVGPSPTIGSSDYQFVRTYGESRKVKVLGSCIIYQCGEITSVEAP